MSRNRKRKTGRKQPGNVTRSARWRAGTRRNKYTRSVPMYASDRRAAR